MRVVGFEPMVCDFGWRTGGFLKLTTNDGIVGWSEFSETVSIPGLGAAIGALAPFVLDQDPLEIEKITFTLAALMRPSRGGVSRQAVAAVENALLDIKGKALGVPVSALLGGAVRDRIPVYWSHCGTYRTEGLARFMGVEPVMTYADVAALGGHVRQRGFRGLKTNVLALEDPALAAGPHSFARGLGAGRLWDNRMIREIEQVLTAFRDGAGDDIDIYLDVNFNFETEGFVRVEQAVRPFKLAWLELDTHDASSLAFVRRRAATPIGSGESLYERAGYRPFFDVQAMDVAIVDVLWNGYLESLKIAALAESFAVPVAPHNFNGHLATMISAHFAAAVPNLHVMEIDIDGVPLRDQVATPPVFEDGHLVLPAGPGWGIEIDEAAIRAHGPS